MNTNFISQIGKRARFGILFAGIASCASVESIPTKPDLPIIAKETAQAAPKHGESIDAQSAQSATSPAIERLVYFRGISGSLSTVSFDDDDLTGRDISLAFNNAPIADVARAVLAEALGQPLTISDGVTGVITLSAPNPVPAAEALASLERALSESGLTLLRTDFGFLLTTVENAVQNAQSLQNDRDGFVGYGVTIVPVRHARASELAQLVDPFISDRVTLSADDARSAIILRGAQADTGAAFDAIQAFDTPFLTDRVFGMFELQYTTPATMQSELSALISGSGVGDQDAQMIALPRLNLLFLSTRTRESFTDMKSWIERLDQPSGGDERRLRYYPVQNTPAEILAAQLNAVFSGGYGGNFSVTSSPSLSGETASSSTQPTFRQSAPIAAPFGSGRATITADELNNALIIRATDQEYREILDLIAQMDVLSPQVLIEATIAEVTLNEDLTYGVRWFFENAESAVSFPAGAPDGAFGPIVPGLNYSYLDNNVSVALDTLASVTDVTVLSAPSIMVLNNQAANLQVGDEVPIITQQAQSVIDSGAPIVSTVQLRNTGVILEVKPRINASDMIVLEITQEVSDVAATTTSGIDSPTIQQRRFTSTVAVKDQSTIALGGLIRETYTDNESGIPVLKDIPALGYAFKSRDISKRRTELIIFLTPRIIRNDADARNAISFIRREMERFGVANELTQ